MSKRGTRLAYVCALLAMWLCLPGVAPGATINVSTFPALYNAVITANPGDEVVIAPGVYHVTSPLYCTRAYVTFRGATGNRDDVVLHGNGMNVESGPLEGFWTANDGIQLRDLTISGFYDHGIHVSSNPSGDLADNVVISNVKLQNCGERYVKGSGGGTSNNVLIENVFFQQNETWLPHTGHDLNYVGGIDAMQTNNWTIRDCRFEGIMGAAGGARGAIFLWQGCTNALIERNVIVDCAEGIDLGNGYNPNDIYHVEGALVRNNFVGWGGGDNRAVQLGFTRNIEFYNNTIYTDTNYNRTVHVYDSADVPSSNVLLKNNLIRGQILDTSTGGGLVLVNNITGATPQANWFVDPANGDFHLTELAAGALNSAIALANVPGDIDGGPRPIGAFPDIGADEYGSPAGDADYDGLVDGLDYVIWSNNYGLPGTWGDANFNGDALVDGLDYVIWSNNYGFGYPVPPGGAVPEPGCLLLLLAAGPLALRRKVGA